MFSQDVISYLDSFINYELDLNAANPSLFKLSRLQQLLTLVGEPQKRLKFIHVAGTKGKGSTCAYLAHILKQAGFRTGLYTSPHLSDVRERIRVLDKNVLADATKDVFADNITKEHLRVIVNAIKPQLEAMRQTPTQGRLTYFEVLTVVALCYFDRCRADYVVWETGLGGRLDATNIVEALLCALTPIDKEHTRQLGTTLDAIAGEKAAIIKPSCRRAVIAPQPPAALQVIRQRCEESRVPMQMVGEDIQVRPQARMANGQTFTVRTPQQEYHLTTGLLGDHQMVNAAVALGLAEALREEGILIKKEDMIEGVAQASWPARCEVVHRSPHVILDCAHTPGSCQHLADTVRAYFPGQRVVSVFGASTDKNILGLCRSLNPITDTVILTRARHPRARRFFAEDGRRLFPGKRCFVTENIRQALHTAFDEADEQDVIVIAGSLFVAGQAREALLKDWKKGYVSV